MMSKYLQSNQNPSITKRIVRGPAYYLLVFSFYFIRREEFEAKNKIISENSNI